MGVQKKMDIDDSWMEEANVAETLCKESPNSVNIDPDSLFLLVDWRALTVNADADHQLQLLKLPKL